MVTHPTLVSSVRGTSDRGEGEMKKIETKLNIKKKKEGERRIWSRFPSLLSKTQRNEREERILHV